MTKVYFENRKKGISLPIAIRIVDKEIGTVLLQNIKNKLVLFRGKRGKHIATYNKVKREFWFVR